MNSDNNNNDRRIDDRCIDENRTAAITWIGLSTIVLMLYVGFILSANPNFDLVRGHSEGVFSPAFSDVPKPDLRPPMA